MASFSRPPSRRLDDDSRRARENETRKRRVAPETAARQAIAETSERELRRSSGLAEEVVGLADDRVDRAERRRLMAGMDAVGAEWPE